MGWLYAARKARSIARKQHTINVMLQANFNSDFRKALRDIAPTVRSKQGPPQTTDEAAITLRNAYRFVMNHYEFVASGLRNGDFDELLVRDSERGTILQLYESCETYIYQIRNSRDRQTSYEHLEWLNDRWKKRPPQFIQRYVERMMSRPFQGKRHNPNL